MPIDEVKLNLDFSQWGGLRVPWAGGVAPWSNRLGSKEHSPNARAAAAKPPDKISDSYKLMLRYFGVRNPFDPSVDIQTFSACSIHPVSWILAAGILLHHTTETCK